MRECGYVILMSVMLVSFVAIKNTDNIIPDHFPPLVMDVYQDALYQQKVQLGRALFYDPRLSEDGTISCASCHSSYNSFAHTDHKLSHGVYDSVGTRNAPGLFNLAWQNFFMHDGAINHIEKQPLAPLLNKGEMSGDLDTVIQYLQSSKLYNGLFINAFGSKEVTGERFLKSLAYFQLSLISADSKYDKVIKGETQFSSQEQKGKEVFEKECSSCHSPPLFSNYQLGSNGLVMDDQLKDFGRYQVTNLSKDLFMFKVPSLRNLSFTYPYMHDGRFQSLTQVLDHYTDGEIEGHMGKYSLKTNIVLNDTQKVDLIAFLLTLNDTAFVFDKMHAFPRNLLINNK